MDYSVLDASRAGFGKVVFIVRNHFRAAFEKMFAKRYGNAIKVVFVEQEAEKELPTGFSLPYERTKPWGTGHALLMAAPEVIAPFAVINADDFYGREAYTAMGTHLTQSLSSTNELYAMVGYQLGKTLSDSGGVSRGLCSVNNQNMLTEVTERHRIKGDANGSIVYETAPDLFMETAPETIVSMNFWGFTPNFFTHLRGAFHQFIRDYGADPNREFYIPAVVHQMVQSNTASVQVLRTNAEWFGVTYKEDLRFARMCIRQLIAKGEYPNSFIQT
jgi:dTDP-glucose pyrophosphorylase